jgi:hypothetical protein
MAAVFLAKACRRDHSQKRDESIDITLDPPQISLDSPFNIIDSLYVYNAYIYQ